MNEIVAICVQEIGNGVVMALLADHRVVFLNPEGDGIMMEGETKAVLEQLRDSATHMLLHLESPSTTHLH